MLHLSKVTNTAMYVLVLCCSGPQEEGKHLKRVTCPFNSHQPAFTSVLLACDQTRASHSRPEPVDKLEVHAVAGKTSKT